MSIKSKNEHQGFVLYEAILALLITVLTLGVLQQSLQILKAVQKTSFRDQLRWHITQEKLQDTFNNAQIISFESDKIVYFDKRKNQAMVLEKYGEEGNYILRLRTAGKGGHIPIITNLNKIHVEKIRELVIITTENKAGQISEMYLTNVC